MSHPVIRTFGFLIHDVARLMRKRYEQRVRHLGLTRAQWQVLTFLSYYEGIQQSGLASHMEVEPITLGRIVDRLESLGLVERRRRSGDRRAWLLYLTEQSAPILEELLAIAARLREEVLADIAPKDREQLLSSLNIIRSKLIDHCPQSAEDEVLNAHT